MTMIYLAYSASGEAVQTFGSMAARGIDVNLLVSFVYLGSYRSRIMPRHPRTILDSGAYSAWKSGKVIDIEALLNETKNPCWGESIGLDVIGDPEASMKNALYMKSRGSPAYPVFHIGDPMEHLDEYKSRFPKVGLSCRFGEPIKKSYAFLDACFARAWPYKFHSFGWVDEKMLARFPFHSADTASWNVGPSAFGRWAAFGRPMSVRGSKSLLAEVMWYLGLQERLRLRWRKTLDTLG